MDAAECGVPTRDTQIGSDRFVSLHETLSAAPGEESGNAVLPLAPDSTEGRGWGSECPGWHTTRSSGWGGSSPGQCRKIMSVRPHSAQRIPMVVPVPTDMPTHSSGPTPGGAASGTRERFSQSSKETEDALPDVEAAGVAQECSVDSSAPNVPCSWHDKDLGSCSGRYKKAFHTLELGRDLGRRVTALSTGAVPSQLGATSLSPVALQDALGAAAGGLATRRAAPVPPAAALGGSKAFLQSGVCTARKIHLAPSSPLPTVFCLPPCSQPPGDVSVCDFCM